MKRFEGKKMDNANTVPELSGIATAIYDTISRPDQLQRGLDSIVI